MAWRGVAWRGGRRFILPSALDVPGPRTYGEPHVRAVPPDARRTADVRVRSLAVASAAAHALLAAVAASAPLYTPLVASAFALYTSFLTIFPRTALARPRNGVACSRQKSLFSPRLVKNESPAPRRMYRYGIRFEKSNRYSLRT